MIPIIEKAKTNKERIAVTEARTTYTYQELLDKAQVVALYLLQNKVDLQEERIAFMALQEVNYITLQWGIWLAGAVAVPISLSHPLPEIEYILEDTGATVLFTNKHYFDFLRPLSIAKNIQLICIEDIFSVNLIEKPELPEIASDRRAMIIYTSGTTSRPKGVVSTHEIISSQISTLSQAWDWQPDDYILEVLPLHHVHGIINVVSCALWVGAKLEFMAKFDGNEVWDKFIEKEFTLFMAVPTIYNKLIHSWENADSEKKEKMHKAVCSMRLMVSGSAALPVNILEKWQKISGHILLERYGMTEIGMAISNPYQGRRKAGKIGLPLPGVDVKLFDENHEEIAENEIAGEIRVKSHSVFKEYWNKPGATKEAFHQGWFCTGDIAERDKEGYYKILGRNSVDIIKTGGFKVSALEIEEILRKHPYILECAVVGIPDEEWGEKIGVGLILQKEAILDIEALRNWAKQYLAHYKIPTLMKVLEELPRNVMGKVVKPALKELFLTS